MQTEPAPSSNPMPVPEQKKKMYIPAGVKSYFTEEELRVAEEWERDHDLRDDPGRDEYSRRAASAIRKLEKEGRLKKLGRLSETEVLDMVYSRSLDLSKNRI